MSYHLSQRFIDLAMSPKTQGVILKHVLSDILAILPTDDDENCIAVESHRLAHECKVQLRTILEVVNRLVEWSIISPITPHGFIPGLYMVNPHHCWKGELNKDTYHHLCIAWNVLHEDNPALIEE